MPINSINSVSFKSAQDNEHAFLYNSDDQMYAAASNGPLHRLSDVSKKTAKTVIIAAPIVDAFLGGAAQNGALTSKLSKSAVILGKWGAMFAVALGVFGIKKAVNNNVKPLKEFDKRHPAMSFVIDFAALFGGLSVLSGFGGKIAEKARRMSPFAAGRERGRKRTRRGGRKGQFLRESCEIIAYIHGIFTHFRAYFIHFTHISRNFASHRRHISRRHASCGSEKNACRAQPRAETRQARRKAREKRRKTATDIILMRRAAHQTRRRAPARNIIIYQLVCWYTAA